MMRWTICASETSTIQAKVHRQILNAHVMDHLVVCPLHERAVDVTERDQSLCSKACRESNCMLFSDTDVECAVGHLLHHHIHRRARWHSRCHTHDLIVLARELNQRVTEHILVLRRLGMIVTFLMDLTCDLVERARRMP